MATTVRDLMHRFPPPILTFDDEGTPSSKQWITSYPPFHPEFVTHRDPTNVAIDHFLGPSKDVPSSADDVGLDNTAWYLNRVLQIASREGEVTRDFDQNFGLPVALAFSHDSSQAPTLWSRSLVGKRSDTSSMKTVDYQMIMSHSKRKLRSAAMIGEMKRWNVIKPDQWRGEARTSAQTTRLQQELRGRFLWDFELQESKEAILQARPPKGENLRRNLLRYGGLLSSKAEDIVKLTQPQAVFLDDHPQPIAARSIGQLNQHGTVHLLELDAKSSPRDFPSKVIVKQEKDGWQTEFRREKEAYKRLRSLQGEVIPEYLGEGMFNDRPAIILSEIVGTPLHLLARETEVDEEALRLQLMDAFKALYEKEAKYWDERLDNFLLCDNRESNPSKVMIVDLEDVYFPEDSPSWENFDQPWEESLNFATACSLMKEFTRLRRLYCQPTAINSLSVCDNHINGNGTEPEQVLYAIHQTRYVKLPNHIII
ncbi:hypothetical protein N7522_006460 [Penicillium canescens]|nr:hypothetical protein N7522_006460 [Penicillium canescens]